MAAPTAASFRQKFLEFADPTRFPNSSVDYWLELSVKLLNATRWGNLLDDGCYLFAAHNLTLERRAMDEAARGAAPGIATGPINNKSVDKVQVGYDSQLSAELDAGHWNTTIYGQRYIRLARMCGTGGLQIGTGCIQDPLMAVKAYAGPWVYNFPNPSQ